MPFYVTAASIGSWTATETRIGPVTRTGTRTWTGTGTKMKTRTGMAVASGKEDLSPLLVPVQVSPIRPATNLRALEYVNPSWLGLLFPDDRDEKRSTYPTSFLHIPDTPKHRLRCSCHRHAFAVFLQQRRPMEVEQKPTTQTKVLSIGSWVVWYCLGVRSPNQQPIVRCDHQSSPANCDVR